MTFHPFGIIRLLACLVLSSGGFGTASSVRAQAVCESVASTSCRLDADCSALDAGWVCNAGKCERNCTEKGAGLCSLGETCVPGASSIGEQHESCRPSKFTMDLNLVDSCIYHFVEGMVPDLSGTDLCSVENRLNQVLDRDGDQKFSIYDVDRCIKDFIDEEPCNSETRTCEDGQVFCSSDAGCGKGLHCNLDLHRCERECGLVRDPSDAVGDGALLRECAGALQLCLPERGECVDADLTKLRCDVDRDCPSAAYCLAARCVPRCFRSLDCPSDDWVCNEDNRCVPRPLAGDDGATPFVPTDYSLVFAQPEVALDPLNSQTELSLLIMNKQTKAQVKGDARAVFGYRLELTYGPRRTPECLALSPTASEAERSACELPDDQLFVRPDSPFGVLSAAQDPVLSVSLNESAAARLPTGSYEAKLTATFDNGASTSTRITFQKASPSGEFGGRLSIYLDREDNLLADTTVGLSIYVDRTRAITWNKLLEENNLTASDEFIDFNQGYAVTGLLHGEGSLVFDHPSAASAKENEIPVKGLYSESSGRMRLIALVDLPKAHCRSDRAARCSTSPTELRAQNLFDRDIRRTLEFIGPFDGATRRFEGMYRETITGLLPHATTLSGGFVLRQINQSDAPIKPGPLLSPGAPRSVHFPPPDALRGGLDAAVSRACVGLNVAQAFATEKAVRAYLQQAPTELGGATYPILGDLITFENRVATALSNLNGATGAITLSDYFKGQIEFCKAGGGATCVDRLKLECGLSLYRKALLSGEWVRQGSQVTWRSWVPVDQVQYEAAAAGLTDKPALFCRRAPGPDSDCTATPAMAPGLVTLQEHNRFYRELVQTYSYEALNGLSDAFYTMYKAANGDALDADSAFQHKQRSLVRAVQNYQAAFSAAASPASTQILVNWPMRDFASSGLTWIKQLHANARDRIEALTQLVDLKRRVLRDVDAADAAFAEDLMHQEYLHQVFLALVQKQWEGETFAYSGQGPEALLRGSLLLGKINLGRNPLGLAPSRVYFENARLDVNNWQALRERVRQGVDELRGTVDGAITEMKNSLRDRDSLMTTLLNEEQQIEQTLDELCGDKDAPQPRCDVPLREHVAAMSCQPHDLTCKQLQRECDGVDCSIVKSYFQKALNNADDVACQVGGEAPQVHIDGERRTCSRGRMGTYLQERQTLLLQRRQVVEQVRLLAGKAQRHADYLATVSSQNYSVAGELSRINRELYRLEGEAMAIEIGRSSAATFADVADCLIIVGFAGGTNCFGKAAAAAAMTAINALANAAIDIRKLSMSALQYRKEEALRWSDSAKELAQLRLGLDDTVAEVEALSAQYQVLTQQILNLNLEIEDTRFIAQRSADRYKERLGDLVDRLVGRESGSVLLRNKLVALSERQFQTLLVDTYKMTQAFVHRYNEAEREHALSGAVFQLMSVQDIDAHVKFLSELEERYCGAEGIDCDSAHNRKVFAYSIRKNLFPELRDTFDSSGKIIATKGQQFHDILMREMIKRRARASGVREQIELPFNIWLSKGGVTGGRAQPYLVNGEECNHILVADRANNSGTVAVNVIGTRLGGGQDRQITYELWRGGTDHIRSCSERRSRYESKINAYTVGWSPYHQFGQQDEAPTFQTHSDGFFACKNNRQLSDPSQYDAAGSCFNFFARDRSLGSPDWKLVIPFLDNEQEWLKGEDLPEHQRPIIEDIVVYFRYNARPIVTE